MKEHLNRALRTLRRRGFKRTTAYKTEGEVEFWIGEIANYEDWYIGKLKYHYGHPSPQSHVRVTNVRDSAILTWFETHQKPKYLADLKLDKNAFEGMKVLDIGAGPMPSGIVFEGCEIYSLDPLYAEYLTAGFPLHYYERSRFINAYSEDMPIENDFFDAVISVNAIDHVDDFERTAKEVRRVLKPEGGIAMHVHYHRATRMEPQELSDATFVRHFGWMDDLTKVASSVEKYGSQAPEGDEYALWRSF